MPTVKRAAGQVFFASVARKLRVMLWPNSRNDSKEEYEFTTFVFLLPWFSHLSGLACFMHILVRCLSFVRNRSWKGRGRGKKAERERKETFFFSQNVNFYKESLFLSFR